MATGRSPRKLFEHAVRDSAASREYGEPRRFIVHRALTPFLSPTLGRRKPTNQSKPNQMEHNQPTMSKTMNDFVNGPLFRVISELEDKHDRNRRPTHATTTGAADDRRWAVTLGNHLVCVSPELLDEIVDGEVCPYQAAINRVISTLMNSDFAHDEGFVSCIEQMISARENSRAMRAAGSPSGDIVEVR